MYALAYDKHIFEEKTVDFGPILKIISQNLFLGEKVETTQLLNISNCASEHNKFATISFLGVRNGV